jgi:hypothetical protein
MITTICPKTGATVLHPRRLKIHVGPIKGGGIGYKGFQMSGGSSSPGGHRIARARRSLNMHKSPISRLLIASKNIKGASK